MDFSRLSRVFIEKNPGAVVTVDSHTAGEPTRLVVGGVPPLRGHAMKEKREDFMSRFDHVRKQLTLEPRGHNGIMAAHLTEPVSPGAAFGLIFMDGRRYPYLCGHATIGAVTTLMEGGMIPAPEGETVVEVDTPSGPMTATAQVENGRVVRVAISMVPSFVGQTDVPLDVPGLGQIRVDTVCVGGFFAMVSADQLPLPLAPATARSLEAWGMAVIDAANAQTKVSHPTRPEVATVDVTEFYDPSGHGEHRGKSAVIYGESHLDRSPCGTGTAAKLTLLHHLGKIKKDEVFRNQSLLGTTFEAKVKQEVRVGNLPAVRVEISGSAHITGVHRFMAVPGDPFPEGYLI